MSLEEKKAKVLACCEAWFNKMDANGDGFLDRAEGESFYLANLMKKTGLGAEDLVENAAATVSEIFEAADTNEDGKVSKAEMLALFKAMTDDTDEEHLDELTEKFEDLIGV